MNRKAGKYEGIVQRVHMRFLAGGVFALLVIGCSPAPPLERKPIPQAEVAALPDNALPAAQPVAPTPTAVEVSQPSVAAKVTKGNAAGVSFEGIEFDSRSHQMIVADQPEGPGSRFADSAAAGSTHGGLAAINAGFFTPEGAPLGLVVSNGQRSGAWNNASSLGSGVWRKDVSGNQSILRRENLGKAAALSSRDLIQAGPMLIDNYQTVSGLEATKTSVRSIVLWDGGTRWWLGITSPCTLTELTQALKFTSAVGWAPYSALNLDGGRSSDLWISQKVAGGPVKRRSPWNRPVRNFLIVVPR